MERFSMLRDHECSVMMGEPVMLVYRQYSFGVYNSWKGYRMPEFLEHSFISFPYKHSHIVYTEEISNDSIASHYADGQWL